MKVNKAEKKGIESNTSLVTSLLLINVTLQPGTGGYHFSCKELLHPYF
ncbi:hypothetical protein [Candidatus Methanoperedens nitratireducens]